MAERIACARLQVGQIALQGGPGLRQRFLIADERHARGVEQEGARVDQQRRRRADQRDQPARARKSHELRRAADAPAQCRAGRIQLRRQQELGQRVAGGRLDGLHGGVEQHHADQQPHAERVRQEQQRPGAHAKAARGVAKGDDPRLAQPLAHRRDERLQQHGGQEIDAEHERNERCVARDLVDEPGKGDRVQRVAKAADRAGHERDHVVALAEQRAVPIVRQA